MAVPVSNCCPHMFFEPQNNLFQLRQAVDASAQKIVSGGQLLEDMPGYPWIFDIADMRVEKSLRGSC